MPIFIPTAINLHVNHIDHSMTYAYTLTLGLSISKQCYIMLVFMKSHPVRDDLMGQTMSNTPAHTKDNTTNLQITVHKSILKKHSRKFPMAIKNTMKSTKETS